MKYNLKNRPKCGHIAQYCSFCRWFEGFEAELREPLDLRKVKLWLANTEDLPLLLRVSAIVGLYQKEILGIE